MSGVENVGDSVIGLVCNSKNSLRSCNFTFFNVVMAMKKSILAVSAAVAIGGMGFAGAAHAVYYFGDGANATYGGVVMGGLAIAKVPYVRWLKWVAPLLGILTVLIVVCLSLGALLS